MSENTRNNEEEQELNEALCANDDAVNSGAGLSEEDYYEDDASSDDEPEEDESDSEEEATIFIPTSEQSKAEDMSPAPKKKKVDFFLVVVALAVVAVVGFSVAFFAGVFDRTENLGITASQLTEKYPKTSGYASISSYTFALPAPSVQEITDTEYSVFGGLIANTLGYDMQITGVMFTKTQVVQELYIPLTISGSGLFTENTELFSVWVPFLQVLYPEMSEKEAAAFLSELYSSQTAQTRGGYKLLLRDASINTTATTVYLYVVGKDMNPAAAQIPAA